MTDLANLRQTIDAVDDEILVLLNRRAELMGQVAEQKDRDKSAFYVPKREREIVARLVNKANGPFPAAAVQPVFQEILSACLSLQKAVRVAYLGPEATFTHLATKQQFGLSAPATPVGSIEGVFEEVHRGRAEFGVVPVENSSVGVVAHTLDMFVESDLQISAEIVLAISHCLLARPGLELAQVERVYSHPQALAQCRRWLTENLGAATQVEATSTAEAARLAGQDAASVAIGSEMAAQLHDLIVLRRSVEDQGDNATRFFVIGHRQAEPTGNDRTSIMVGANDEAGTLYRALEPFYRHGVNLSKIQSRPSRGQAWGYVFFVDLDGHCKDDAVAHALAEVKERCDTVKLLGSYPCAKNS